MSQIREIEYSILLYKSPDTRHNGRLSSLGETLLKRREFLEREDISAIHNKWTNRLDQDIKSLYQSLMAANSLTMEVLTNIENGINRSVITTDVPFLDSSASSEEVSSTAVMSSPNQPIQFGIETVRPYLVECER